MQGSMRQQITIGELTYIVCSSKHGDGYRSHWECRVCGASGKDGRSFHSQQASIKNAKAYLLRHHKLRHELREHSAT